MNWDAIAVISNNQLILDPYKDEIVDIGSKWYDNLSYKNEDDITLFFSLVRENS